MSRPAFSAGQSQRSIPFFFQVAPMATLATFAAHTSKFTMPWTGLLMGATLNVGTRGGTHVTSTLDVQVGGVSIFAATFNVQALTPGTIVLKEGAAAFSATGLAAIAKDAVISIITVESGGTSPTWADATLQLDFAPVGD